MSVDFDYDEHLGNPAHTECLLTLETDNNFYVATSGALPWREPEDAPGDRMVVPGIFIESLLRKAPVADPSLMRDRGCLSSTIGVAFINQWLSVLVDELHLIAADDGDQDSVRDFRDFDELQLAADGCMHRLTQSGDFPGYTVEVDDSIWDDLEAVPDRSDLAWLEGVTLGMLCASTGTLEAYVDLMKVVGPHAIDADRTRGQIHIVAGGANGGQLVAVMKQYYLTAAQAAIPMPPEMMAYRVPEFLRETRWPTPYAVEFNDLRDYAFDLSARVTWSKASRLEWAALAHSKIEKALRRMPMLSEVLDDLKGQPASLVRDVERLGDAVLKGEQSLKRPFSRVMEVEQYLGDNMAGLVAQSRAAGVDSTKIIERIIELAQPGPATEKSLREGEDDTGRIVEIVPPKRGQIVRALGEASYAELERRYLGVLLQEGQPDKDSARLLAPDCFAAKTVLTKAVLLATPGMRIATYTGHSDFLALLQDERRAVPLYLGQCMAYDEMTDKVPKSLRVFALDLKEYELLRKFEWAKMDPMNAGVLRLRAVEIGGRFTHHDVRKLYHDGDMITHTSSVFGQLFRGLGYPQHVEASKGLTFEGFMARIKRLHTATLAMTDKQASAMFKLIDEYVQEGFDTAAAHAKVTIYSANPADKKLEAWLPRNEPVVQRLLHSVEKLEDVQDMRVALPGVTGEEPQARTLPGFAKATNKMGQDGSREKGYDTGKKPVSGKASGGSSTSAAAGSWDDEEATAQREERLRSNPKKVHTTTTASFRSRKHCLIGQESAGNSSGIQTSYAVPSR